MSAPQEIVPTHARERPLGFAGVVGQDEVIETLRNRLRDQRSLDRHLAFVGRVGAGKMTLARLYAQALICESREEDGSPCQTCGECKGVDEGSWAYRSIDVLNYAHDEEAVRILVEGDSKLNPARVRILVFENADQLTSSAADVALKMLEKNTKTVFIFLVSDVAKFSGALRSRSQVFLVRPVEASVLVEHLSNVCMRQAIKYEPAALAAIARASNGLCGRAMRMLAKVAGCGAVTRSNTLIELGLDWGPAMVDCWRAILEGRFDEAARKSEALGLDGPGVVSAMQAFLLALELRHEFPTEGYPVSPALEVIPEGAWAEIMGAWERFAEAHAMKAGDLIRILSALWRGVRSSAPVRIALQRTHFELAALVGSSRVEPSQAEP